MANIKPAEVSKILRQQLEGIQTGVELEEVGTVLQVGDGIARIYGLSNAESNELIEFENGIEAIVLNLEEDNIGAVLLGPTEEINEGDIVKRTGRIASIGVGEGLLGTGNHHQQASLLTVKVRSKVNSLIFLLKEKLPELFSGSR